MNQLLQLWTGPLPQQELHPDRKYNPLVHWLFHPLKRHVARLYLQLLQNVFGLKVIAITGSAGKTTTKELLHSILKWSGPTVASIGNITPTYNIPASILSCSFATRFLILEMGVEYPGDMDFYTWLAQPDISIITSVNRTHTSYLKDIAGVAAEKGKIAAATYDTVLINSDDPNIKVSTNASVKTFGHHSDDACQILSSQINSNLQTEISIQISNFKFQIKLPLLGPHFASNAAAAALTASLLDIPQQMIVHGLETATPPPHRMQVIHSGDNIIIDDTYNANPLAVKASLDTLKSFSQTCLPAGRISNLNPVFVFGQMNELGQYEQSAHEEIGTYVKKLGIRDFYCVGPATKYSIQAAGYGKYFETQQELADSLSKLITGNSKLIILFKASHSFHFEELVDSFVS